ncbi:ABC transporter ATP-binding protein [Salmonella enterica subsp. enterica]|uniref:ABC transporter ATP-binding protein n=1 Tax=Salmonella enterica I TaxID=59201 RepID=A0A447TM86_SALET|nr:ABC transporter ATP-binding protein [Salmonella enterica subsp. enterica]
MKNLLSKLEIGDIYSGFSAKKARYLSLRVINIVWWIPRLWRWKCYASRGVNSVFSQLSEQGVQVLSMRNKANRLEELFVSLVHEKQGDRA